MFFDPLYLIFMLPGLALSLWANFRTKSAFKKYSKIPSATGLSGAQAAQRLLDSAGIDAVRVIRTKGFLSDHYNPINKTLALSEEVHDSSSLSAIGVATHEAGHAIQHARNYGPLWVRSMLVPTASLGSSIGYIVMALGLFMASQNMVLIGAVLFSAVLLFQIVTLPVEFDATRRAKELVVAQGIISPHERQGVDHVLNAAAMTYVAAAVSTLFTLLYFLLRSGLLGGNDD
jgi:Zn-dependent membrane protease YugP